MLSIKAARRSRKREYKKRLAREYKIMKKCRCGESDPDLLTFHHRDPNTKTDNVSDLMSGSIGIRKMKDEIRKCDVLCIKCHRLEHVGNL